MATRGKLEGRITVPVGGWAFLVNDSGGGGAASGSIPAGVYFLSSPATTGSSLIDAFAAALNVAASTDTLTVSLSAGEAGTGKVTITSSGSTVLDWDTSTELRDLLGFSTDLAAGTSWTGSAAARGLWLPDCAFKAPNGGGWRGWPESDFIANEHQAGLVAAFMGRSRMAMEIKWAAVSRPRVWQAHEATVNESWERFARDCIWATTSSWGKPGGPIRFYPDAATNTAFGTYTVQTMKDINPEPLEAGWVAGPWQVSLTNLILDPNYSAYGG
jgi:hypothetical protein